MSRFTYKTLEEALENTYYFVEADSFSRHALWVMYVDRPFSDMKPIKWGEVSPGWWETLPGGTCVGFSFGYIYHKLVCFYNPTSETVHWNDVDAFISTYRNKGRGKTDANNFGHCIVACRDAAGNFSSTELKSTTVGVERQQTVQWMQTEGEDILKELLLLHPKNHPQVVDLQKQLEELREIRGKLNRQPF